MSRHPLDVNAVVRDVMAECDGDRDRAVAILIERGSDPSVNESFRVLGIKQAVRSFQTDARSGPKAATRIVSQHQHRSVSPAVAKARKAVDDVVESFMQMHTLFGGRVTLKRATRPDFKRSADAYGGQEAGARRMREFHTDCMDELPKGSVVAVLPVSKYPTIFKLAQERGIVECAT